MKDILKNIWVNCQTVVYTILTLAVLILVLVGSILALPLVIVLLVGVVIFGAYKIGIAEDDADDHYDMNNMYRTNKRYDKYRYKMEDKYRSLDDD